MLVPNCTPTLGVSSLVNVCVNTKLVPLTLIISPAFNVGVAVLYTLKVDPTTAYKLSAKVVPLTVTYNGDVCPVAVIVPVLLVNVNVVPFLVNDNVIVEPEISFT